MDEDERLIWMFNQAYGAVTESAYLDVNTDDDNITTISVMKGSGLCWAVTKTDLVFDYLTKDM